MYYVRDQGSFSACDGRSCGPTRLSAPGHSFWIRSWQRRISSLTRAKWAALSKKKHNCLEHHAENRTGELSSSLGI